MTDDSASLSTPTRSAGPRLAAIVIALLALGGATLGTGFALVAHAVFPSDFRMGSGVVALCALTGTLAAVAIPPIARLLLGPSVNQLSAELARAREASDELELRAGHDPLTGLPNRALFLMHLAQSLDGARRDGSTVAVLFLDLDRFKSVNDSLGHREGDRLLCVISERLRSLIREADVVARLGGDEFVILVNGLREPSQAISLAERVADAVGRPIGLGATEATVSTSIGIAVASPDTPAESPELLVRNADMAMYRAKHTGSGRYEVFDAEMQRLVTARQELDEALRTAVELDQIGVVYQPIVNVATGLIWGFAASARWSGPGSEPLQRADLMATCDRLGLMPRMGAQLTTEACRQVASWRDRWPTRHLGLIVGISARQLADPEMVSMVEAAVANSGLNPGTLTLEVAESVLGSDADATRVLRDIKLLGIKIAVDDFGTGFTSLLQLRSLPVDVVKVGRGLLECLGSPTQPGPTTPRRHEAGQTPETADDSRIVAAIVHLAQEIGIRTIADGVVTSEQLATLASLGCDYAQGGHISPPTTPQDIEALLSAEPVPRSMPFAEAAAWFGADVATSATP